MYYENIILKIDWSLLFAGGGGALYLKLDIILVKRIHVIRVVYEDQAMCARRLFSGAKTCKIWKRVCFGHIDTFRKGYDGLIKKKRMQKRILRVYFRTWKIRVYSSVASPFCQEGQSERNLLIFAISSQFFLLFPIFLILPDFFQIFGKFFTVRGGTLTPLPPQWLRHCVFRVCFESPYYEDDI